MNLGNRRQELKQSAKALNEMIQASFIKQDEIKKFIKDISLKNVELGKIYYKIKYK